MSEPISYIPVGLDVGALCLDLARKHTLAAELLTEKQLAEAIRQAIASGEFVRLVSVDNSSQQVTYIPFRELEEVKSKYNELIYAVARKYDGETRHDTALRYIRERENVTSGR